MHLLTYSEANFLTLFNFRNFKSSSLPSSPCIQLIIFFQFQILEFIHCRVYHEVFQSHELHLSYQCHLLLFWIWKFKNFKCKCYQSLSHKCQPFGITQDFDHLLFLFKSICCCSLIMNNPYTTPPQPLQILCNPLPKPLLQGLFIGWEDFRVLSTPIFPPSEPNDLFLFSAWKLHWFSF